MTTLWTLFEAATAAHAERTAVLAAGDPRSASTYAALDRRVRALALRLRAAGVRPGDRVALLAPNVPAYLDATFAVAGVGAVLQPLNSRLAVRELNEVLADAETRVLLATAEFVPLHASLAGAGASVPLLELDGIDPDEHDPASFRPDASHATDLAHLYYTSGTTGRPKGVMLTHRNVCTHAFAAIDELELDASDRWGHFAPMFHLADAWATVAITAAGGTHVFEPRFTPEGALDRIANARVTITNLVPTMLNAMIANPRARGFDPSSLRMILSGGAPISPALVRRVIETFRCEYVQTYGMTETSPYLTLSLLHDHLRELPEEEALRYRARTGRPFAGVELEIVDASGARVPADDTTVGEIRVRGASVSPGYWRRPEETDAAFRDGWLHTGDLAVVDDEGYVNIVDRKKDMIVTGGENVYSTEVENALSEHASVREVAVYGVPDAEWGERVCAAVVLHGDAVASADELVVWCRERIAGYKLPRHIELCEDLPKTATGKVSKATLRDRHASGARENRPIDRG